MQADCYKAYIPLGQNENIEHVACVAHARRYFVDVYKTSKKEGLASQVIKLMGKLYALEEGLKETNASQDIIFKERNQSAKSILDEIKK